MSTTTITETSSETFQPHWVSRAAFPVLSVSLLSCQMMMGAALARDWYWLAVPLVLVCSHLMHGLLIGFHEASHGLLRKNRFINDLDGILLGILSFTPFTLYRAAHQTHHAHLGSERDEELWPFVNTSAPRWSRVLAAVLELTVGIFFTPFLFFRTFFRKGSPIRSRKVRRRIWSELILTVVVWSLIISAVSWFGVWKYFLWLYAVPAVVAGNLQSWRKYIEHVGLTGSTVRSATRSVVCENTIGRLFAFTLLHEPYHGVHHQHAGLTHPELPRYTSSLEPRTDEEKPPFQSYRSALVDLLKCLADPKVGAQWHRRSEAAPAHE